MRFALIDGERREPQPGMTGTCPGCGAEVNSKCGRSRVWHWAHRVRACDPWWEPETEWHRAWKNMFPTSWQEVPLRAQSGELHIADLRAPSGLVMEFQHSAIRPQECDQREAFYQNMLWIVDCTRLKRDVPRIDQNLRGWRRMKELSIQQHAWPDEILPKQWLERSVPVLFDFTGHANENATAEGSESPEPDYMVEGRSPAAQRRMERLAAQRAIPAPPAPLICLLPGRIRQHACYFAIGRDSLVKVGHAAVSPFDGQHTLQRLAERAALAAAGATRRSLY